MKLCLVGDSHAAMLIAAHRQAPGDLSLCIVAKPGLDPADLALEGSVLRATSPDLLTRLERTGTPAVLDLAEFDAVVVAGLAPSAFAAVRLQQGHSVAGWPSGKRAMARALTDEAAPKARPLMTRAAYGAALRALTDESLAATLARAAPCPIAVVPQPFPSEALLARDDKYPIFRRVVRNGDGAALAGDLTAAHRAVFAALGALYLPQPADTVAHGCLTRADLIRGGPRLSDGSRQDSDDVLHGNARLGARLLDDLRAALPGSLQTTSNP